MDHQIRERLFSILTATGWFTATEVNVRDGVVFLKGRTDSEKYKKWAGDLARNTQDVAAVVNQMDVTEPPSWDFSPAAAGLRDLGRSVLRGLPLFAFAIMILFITWIVATLVVRFSRILLRRRIKNPLLREVFVRGIGFGVFLIGLYTVFQVAGLTSIALTVIGGTGLLGLAVGIAFREITENFLASIFLSIQTPFRTGDLVDVAGTLGYVQGVTTRATILMTLDGNRLQIPNATVYKSTIRNFSSNPNRREDFEIGIGYKDAISTAQEIAMKVLTEHPAVLKDPEPWVLADNLGKSSVVLRVYFWLDGSQHSWLKVKSSVIRGVKRAYQSAGISIPDEAREMIFPDGVPVRMLEAPSSQQSEPTSPAAAAAQDPEEPESISEAEGGLSSEAGQIQEQARQSRPAEEGQNLLKPSTEP